MITELEMIHYANKMMQFCDEQEFCSKCPFDMGYNCIFKEYAPSSWSPDFVKRKMLKYKNKEVENERKKKKKSVLHGLAIIPVRQRQDEKKSCRLRRNTEKII